MAEGTNVGNIYLDLIVRDTIEKQVQDMAAQGQKTAQKAFAGMEKTAEASVNKVAAQAGKVVQKAAAPLGNAFNKPVEIATAKLKQLENEFSALSLRAEGVMRKDTSFRLYGYVSDDNKEFKLLEKQLDSLYRRMEAARERLTIETQAAAQKQAAVEEREARRAAAAAEKAALRQQLAAQKAAEKAAAAAARSAAKREREERKAAIAAEKAAQKAAAAEEKAANRRKGILASMWKNMLANAGASAKSISGKISGIIKKFTTAGKATRRFDYRLREIVRGALIFNGISAALRGMARYLGEGITASKEMKQALANLKGAAANAASPLIQVLTPALTSLANAAATALTYVEKFLTSITGKVSNAADLAAKKAEKTAKKAERTLAGFDQLNKLNGNNDSDEDSGDDEIEPNYNFKGYNSFLESLLSAIKVGKWGQVGALIAEKLNSALSAIPWDTILQKVKNWTQNFVDALNGFIHKVDFGLIGTTLGQGLNTLLIIIDTFFQGIDWKTLGVGFATGLENLITSVDWPMLGRVLTDKLKALFEFFHGFITTFDFKTLGTSLAQMLNAAFDNIDWEQLWQDIKLGLLKLFEGICAFFAELEPDVLSAAINLLLLKAAMSAFEILKPVLGKALSDGLLSLLQGAFTSIKTWATGTMLPKITGWITGTLVPQITAAFGGVASALGISVGWVAVIAAAIVALVAVVIKNWDKISAWTKKTWGKIRDIWDAAPEWFNDNIVEPVASFFSDLWKKIGQKGADAWASMKQTWGEVSSWFRSNVVNPIQQAFANVYSSASNIWISLVSFIRNAVNRIIGSINGMISGIVGGINTAIRALNRLSFTIPSWFQYVPGAANLAGKSVGFNIATITAPQIPYLADGGVIKQPTLAMVGEYAGASNNPEIVAPQSLIAETVTSVMEDMMLNNQMSLMEVVSILRQILNAVVSISSGNIRIFIGEHEVFQVIVEEHNRVVRRTGKSPWEV